MIPSLSRTQAILGWTLRRVDTTALKRTEALGVYIGSHCRYNIIKFHIVTVS
jgi:hypothetical protein